MKAYWATLSLLLTACSTTQPDNKTLDAWVARPLEPRHILNVAWFDGDWRLCEAGTDCPKTTNKTAIRTISLKALPPAGDKATRKEQVTIHFDFDSSEPKNINALEKLLQTVGANDRLLITGYTDSLGDENYNELLARKRANKVFAWLRQRGVRNLLEIGVGGACCYLAPNNTEKGRALNRRVVVEIIH